MKTTLKPIKISCPEEQRHLSHNYRDKDGFPIVCGGFVRRQLGLQHCDSLPENIEIRLSLRKVPACYGWTPARFTTDCNDRLELLYVDEVYRVTYWYLDDLLTERFPAKLRKTGEVKFYFKIFPV